MRTRRLTLIACAALAAACSGDPASTTSGEPDSGSLDAGADASSPDDAGVDPEDLGADLGEVDSGVSDMAAQADAGGALDAGVDAGVEPGWTSGCDVSDELVLCPRDSVTLWTGAGGFVPREVHWLVPQGEKPEGGWPAVMLFQGSFFSAEYGWGAPLLAPFGGYYQALLIHELLEAGFVVIAPEANFGGATFWDTNVPPWATSWELSGDHQFMLDIFDEMAEGTFGELDEGRLYATGISSGGYMTSRMAVSYEGRFRALAIQAASYAWCGGALCTVPSELPEDHPPTLFLHGELDVTVPRYTMDLYYDELESQGFEVERIVDASAGHEWLSEAPEKVRDWFSSH